MQSHIRQRPGLQIEKTRERAGCTPQPASPTTGGNMIPNLCTDLVTPVSEFDRSQVTPVTCATRRSPGSVSFVGVTINHAHYRDVHAACGCKDLSLVRVGFQAYTLCKEHQLADAGPLVRAVGRNGRPA